MNTNFIYLTIFLKSVVVLQTCLTGIWVICCLYIFRLDVLVCKINFLCFQDTSAYSLLFDNFVKSLIVILHIIKKYIFLIPNVNSLLYASIYNQSSKQILRASVVRANLFSSNDVASF